MLYARTTAQDRCTIADTMQRMEKKPAQLPSTVSAPSKCRRDKLMSTLIAHISDENWRKTYQSFQNTHIFAQNQHFS
jgi:hypothetical protein